MNQDGATLSVALLGVGSLLLLVAAGALFTGNLHIVRYAVPVAFVAGIAVYAGIRRLDRTVDAST